MATIKSTVESQLPAHVVQEYPLFVEFLKGYYEWLESTGSPYHALKNHLSWLDMKGSMEEYVSHLRQEYLHNVPLSAMSDIGLFVRYAKQFHLSTGTEDSYKFIFKLLFGEEGRNVELYYPKKDMLITSDGKWIGDEQMILITANNPVEELLYKVVSQTRETSAGKFETTKGIVQRVTSRYAGKYKFTELYISDVEGDFGLEVPVTIGEVEEWILPSGNFVEIVQGGQNYSTNSNLSIDASTEVYKQVLTATGNVVDTRFTTVMEKSDLVVKVNGVIVTDYEYDGSNIRHPSITLGSVIEIDFPVYAGFFAINGVNTTGGITDITILDSPIGISKDYQMQVFSGTGANITVGPGIVKKLPGYYLNDDGWLSSTKKLQDSNYYQDYSYVIKSGIDVDRYKDVVLSVLHPAGTKMFGQVNIIELVKLMIKGIDFEVSKKPVSVLVEATQKLGPQYGSFEKLRLVWDWRLYVMNDFKELIVEDIVRNWTKPYGFEDAIVITSTQDYVYVNSNSLVI